MEYYSAGKKNTLLKCINTWMKLRNTKLTKISQMQEYILSDYIYMMF